MFENLIMYRWKDLNMVTTEHLLRIFLGVTDKLLQERESDDLIGQKIAAQTSRLVFEVYLRSSFSITKTHTHLITLWDLLGKFATR